MRINKLLLFIFWIVLFEGIGMFLGLITNSDLSTWYQTLNRSSLTPPGYVFSIVWPLLYALLAYIAWILTTTKNPNYNKLFLLFALQMVMNWAWTPLFFTLHLQHLSAIWLLILTFINIVLLLKARNVDKKIVFALTPYIIWLAFASYLNLIIVMMN